MGRNLKVEVFYGYLFEEEDVPEDIVEGDIPAELHWEYFGCLEYDCLLALVVKRSQGTARGGSALALDSDITSGAVDTTHWDDMLLRYLESIGFPDPEDSPRWYAAASYG